MRWKFESSAAGGLRVISEIPDINPCLIEGRNGIGKTVSVQLLQLASGTIPDAIATHTELWQSLRNRLGETRIVGTELDGAESVEFVFTPSEWPESPTANVGLLGRARINGEDVDAQAFANLLHVERIAGNEDLAATIERHRDVLESQLADVAAMIRARQALVNEVAGSVIEDLRHNDPQVIAHEIRAVEDSERKERVARDQASEAVDHLEAIQRAQDLLRKRDLVDSDAQKLLDQRDAALARTRDLEGSLAEAQKAADDLANRLEDEGGVGQQLARAGRTMRLRKSRLDNQALEVLDTATALDVEAAEDAISDALSETESQLDEALAQQRRLDTAGQVKLVLDEMIPVVGGALADMSDELLADGFTPTLTVREAHSKFQERRDTLGSQPTPAQIREISMTIASLTLRRGSLVDLSSALTARSRTQELFETAQAEYAELEKKVARKTQTAQESREADAEVGRHQAALNEAHEELAALTQRLQAQGTMSRADADRDILEIVEQLGIAEADIPAAADRLRDSATQAEQRLIRAEIVLVDSRRRVTSRRTELSRAVARLATDEAFNWLTTIQRLVNDEGQVDLDAYARVRTAVLAAIDTIAEAERTVAILQGLCREFLRARHGSESELDGGHGLAAPFAAVLARRMLNALNSPSIRERVFDGGEAVDLDPVNSNITLRWESGKTDIRAMASFSTGQQAFAFTQARISDLEPSLKPNRLLVLDEFGAFVSADRMPDLAAFLATEAVTRVADQVLVILPLQVNYEIEIENTMGELRVAYEHRLAQIRQRNYCAVEL